MLREFVEKKHYLFAKEAKDWEDAIIMSCKSLEADGTVESNYAHDIVECVRKYGRNHAEHRDAAFPGGRSRSQ